MYRDLWKTRAILRSDMTTSATHLTKGKDDDEAFNTLWKILTDKVLIAGNGFVVSNWKVCCFQDVPLIAIAENLRYEQENQKIQNRYSPFGIRIDKLTLYQKWGRPVIYGISDEVKRILPEREHWRIVMLNLEDSENIIDWTHEREWRIKRDMPFEYEEIEIILKDSEYYKRFVERCFDENKEEIIKQVKAIIPLSCVYS